MTIQPNLLSPTSGFEDPAASNLTPKVADRAPKSPLLPIFLPLSDDLIRSIADRVFFDEKPSMPQ